MIIVKLVGGLASQLHKYAIGKALAKKHQAELKLDLSWFKSPPETDTPWPFVLDNFGIEAKEATDYEIKKFKPNRLQFIFMRILKKLLGINLSFRNYSNESFLQIEEFFLIPDDTYLEGEFAGFKYIESVKVELQKEIKSGERQSVNFQHYLKLLNTGEVVVAIHFRRGDFISNESASKFHYVCSERYYQESILYLKNKIHDFSLLVFSDDLEWVKENISFEQVENVEFVEGLQNHEEFHLMAMCSHNIISNSGFSWFPAWLNSNENIIVSPTKWVRDEKVNENLISDLAGSNIVFIDNE